MRSPHHFTYIFQNAGCTNTIKNPTTNHGKEMDPPGFEPGASGLQSRRSPSLSYGPKENQKKNTLQCYNNTMQINNELYIRR